MVRAIPWEITTTERADVPIEQKWVLIVDDEERVAFFLGETLKALGKGLAVVSVGSAEEALEQLARRHFDLVVTDLRMPGMDGLELMQQVKETHPQTRTILITAYGSEEVEAKVRRLHPASYLTKPFPVVEFTQAVEQALQLDQGRKPANSPPFGRAEAVRRALATLRRGTGARCALLVNREGRVIAQAGTVGGLPLAGLLSTLLEEASITARLNRHLEGGADVSLHHYEGRQHQVHAAIAIDAPFMLVLLSQQPPPRRSGVVWLFLRRTLEELRELLGMEGASALSLLSETGPLSSLTPAQARALGLLSEETKGQER
ncbi:MAG TPA: response regulator [Anaerolineales bacterium]|nr:response regulator [Anaerolineae bacterium]HIQ01464.1 response regulator [Anaerolineales bacterium]